MMHGLRRVALGLTFSFLILGLGLVYWQVVRAQVLLENPANRRFIVLEQRIERGGIFDRNGEILAQSVLKAGKKVRVYPKGAEFEPAVGYATLLHGSAGLEGALADWLLGMSNETLTQQVRRTFQLPRQGDDVVLTLDGKLQQIAYDGLQGKAGAAVAIDPRTGEVLALASQPSFDPNDLDRNWPAIVSESGSPLSNHAFSLFPPGSTFKVVTSLDLFRAGLNTSQLYDCTGQTIVDGQYIPEQNHEAHGWVNYNLALADSCNTYFATFANQAGPANFLAAAKAFGFGQQIPLELDVPMSRLTKQAALPAKLPESLLPSSAFGQGQVMVSPFQMALITACIADHGVMMKPHLVDRVLAPGGQVVYTVPTEPWLHVMSKEEADKITSAMITAVNEGTAAPGALPGVQVAAKTGSAEPGGNVPTHAWYIAFAPADKPTIAVAVLVQNGGTGGGAAAPIARRIIKAALSESR
ncbi:penicillin-binding protein A [Peptococcaceae bacterium CEB3]|nr:penicillin-binding protein A [Peptococcaceae bacterium CEB3]